MMFPNRPAMNASPAQSSHPCLQHSQKTAQNLKNPSKDFLKAPQDSAKRLRASRNPSNAYSPFLRSKEELIPLGIKVSQPEKDDEFYQIMVCQNVITRDVISCFGSYLAIHTSCLNLCGRHWNGQGSAVQDAIKINAYPHNLLHLTVQPALAIPQ